MSMSSRMLSKVTKTLPRFLAYCSILQACRSLPQVRRGLSVAVALILPDGADEEAYEKAAYAVLHGEQMFDRFHRADETAVFSCWQAAGKGARNFTSQEALAYGRVFVLARTQADVPTEFAAAADAMLVLRPPELRHVIAAVRLCLGQHCSSDEAEAIVATPMPLVGLTLRRGRPLRQSLDAMRRAAAAPKEDATAGPRLQDMHGLGEAGRWGLDLAQDLADWKAGRIPWSHVDRGVLVSGPPGTGKTSFARALANSCDAHLVLGSIGRWQAKGHLGDMLKAMRAAFDEARKNAPAVIFLDELDALGDRETLDDRHRQYATEVIAALLECVDGADKVEGVVVVGATNHPGRIDAAMLRPGRLDRHVVIPLPDVQARQGILRWHLGDDLAEADLSAIAARTEGSSGADLEQVVRDARRRARRARKDMAVDDLMLSLPPLHPVPDMLRRRTAVHEAGHVVVALAVGGVVLHGVEVFDVVDPSKGDVQRAGGALLSEPPMSARTKQDFLDRITIALGGMAAEEVILGSPSAGAGGRPGSDLYLATLGAVMFETSFGFGRGLAYLSSDQEADLMMTLHASWGVRERVEAVLKEQMDRAIEIVRDARADVELLGQALLERGRLSADEVRELLHRQPSLLLLEDGQRKAG